jgi:hypothetical protein
MGGSGPGGLSSLAPLPTAKSFLVGAIGCYRFIFETDCLFRWSWSLTRRYAQTCTTVLVSALVCADYLIKVGASRTPS